MFVEEAGAGLCRVAGYIAVSKPMNPLCFCFLIAKPLSKMGRASLTTR